MSNLTSLSLDGQFSTNSLNDASMGSLGFASLAAANSYTSYFAAGIQNSLAGSFAWSDAIWAS